MKLFLIIMMCMVSYCIYSIDYETYEMKRVHEFKASEGTVDNSYLKTNFYDQDPTGPMIFFDNDTLVLADQNNNRTLLLNEDYSFDNSFSLSFFEDEIYKMDNNFLGLNKVDGIVISKDWEFISRVSFDDIEKLRQPKSIFYHSNILFIHDKNSKLWSINNPGLDANMNINNLLNEEETLEIFNKTGDIDGLTIDSKNRLFLNGELQTVDYAVFYKYYKKKHNSIGKMSIKLDTEVSYEASSGMIYIGRDSNDNYYWTLGRKHICVFTPTGLLVDLFKYNSKKSSTTPTVSPEGDIYFMHHAPELVTLYKIERKW